MKPFRCSLSILLALFVCSLAIAADPVAPPTYEQLKQMYADQQYQPLLQKLAPLLNLHGPAGEAYDHYQLYLLKAETHIQLKSAEPAIMALHDASKVAEEKNKPNDVIAAVALAELVKKSPGMVYKHINSPDKAHPETFKVTDIDPDKRKAAFAALFDDGLTAAQPRLKVAMSNNDSVKPALEFAKSVGPLRDIEIAATGASKQCDEVLGGLATHAQQVIATTLISMGTQVDAIKKKADTVVQVNDSNSGGGYGSKRGGTGAAVYRRQGLVSTDTNALRGILDTCTQIQQGAKLLADSLGDPGGKFVATVQDADKLAQKTKAVLDTDYTATASSPSAFH